MRTIVPLAALLLIAAHPMQEKKGASDAELIQGRWEIVSGEQEGKAFEKKDSFIGSTLTFDDTKLTIRVTEQKNTSGTFSLKSDQKPKQIDFKTDKSESTLGIYELDGDALKICIAEIPGKPRPTKFSTEDEKPYVLSMVLKRVKK